MQSRFLFSCPYGLIEGLHSVSNPCNKIPYQSQPQAELALKAIQKKRRSTRRELGSYLCPDCRRWHLTSKSSSQVPPWLKR